MKYKNLVLYLFLLILSFLCGCFIVKKLAGADIDPERFAKARESKMVSIRSVSAMELAKRLNRGDNIENADIIFYLDQNLLNKLAKQYDSTSGWLDESTSYIIKGVNVALANGSAIASVAILAHENPHNVDVNLSLDCILAIELINNELVVKFEPFNISPNVTAGGLFASADELIGNLIKINLADLSNKFPPMKIPIDFSNNIILQSSKTDIRDKINMNISSPQSNVLYKLKLKEILIFERKILIALNIDNIEMR